MGNRYEAAKGKGGQILELFRKTDDGEYEKMIRGEWVESDQARDVFYGYGTFTFRVTEDEANEFVDAMKNGTLREYSKKFEEE